jgi:hypothetical protein
MNRPALIIVPLNCGNHIGSVVFDDGETIAWPNTFATRADLIADFSDAMQDEGRCS